MKQFAILYDNLDSTTSINEKLGFLKSYFRSTPAEDACWALYFLSGEKIPRPFSTSLLREWISEFSNIPLWLLEESYHSVGDLAETLSLLAPGKEVENGLTLSALSTTLGSLKKLTAEEQKQTLFCLLGSHSQKENFLLFKLLTGSLRVGIQRTLLAKALSELSGLSPAEMTHRLIGGVKPEPEFLSSLLSSEIREGDSGLPYPFCLAYPLEGEVHSLGDAANWLVEWKWDGIRAQAICRGEEPLLWSRGEEGISDSFPELVLALRSLPKGLVLDGEILAWQNQGPLPFSELQKRLGRKTVSKRLQAEVPVHFLCYDLLEKDGKDLRALPTRERRALLEELLQDSPSPLLSLSPQISFASWDSLTQLRQESRGRGAEGVMLKHLEAAYETGRKKGVWWKWKVEPYTCDAVLFYAQRGHGRRAGLFTDFTFAIWKGGELVPVAKAYSGLSDEEFREVNRFIRDNTIERFGPVVAVTPELVFELAFDDLRLSRRHKAGLALRFPRMVRMRTDKKIEDADSLETLSALLRPGSLA